MSRSSKKQTDSFLHNAIRRTNLETIEASQNFDAIVVGAGAAGGLAAMLLTRGGLNVLLLDAGWRRSVRSDPFRRTISFCVSSMAAPAVQRALPGPLINVGQKLLRGAGKIYQPVQSKCFSWPMAPDAFVDDRENGYVNAPGSRFDWFRAHQIGGRMIIPGHGQQYYRLAPRDLFPDDGLSPPWPIEASELDRWYDDVEQHLGLVGGAARSDWIPDAKLRETIHPSEAEIELSNKIKSRWSHAEPILGRSAPPLDAVETAAATGRLSCRTGALVREVIVDQGVARGVRWFDRETRSVRTARSPVVFLCASSLETTRILLASQLDGAHRIGEQSGALGRYLMDHVIVSGEGSGGPLPGEPVSLVQGRSLYLPRFDQRDGRRSVNRQGRGFGVQLYRWSTGQGRSSFNAVSFGEMTPHHDNRVTLDPIAKDAWGMPVLRIECRHSEAELAQASSQRAALLEIGELLEINFSRLDSKAARPGTAIHECGTARMGDSASDSVLNPYNECWDVRNLYVTDASCFPSQGSQNPTLTIMALTARACDRVLRSVVA
jgi:choline dehydrogenase-like flavoprotein